MAWDLPKRGYPPRGPCFGSRHERATDQPGSEAADVAAPARADRLDCASEGVAERQGYPRFGISDERPGRCWYCGEAKLRVDDPPEHVIPAAPRRDPRN